jgi:hypothetical protein
MAQEMRWAQSMGHRWLPAMAQQMVKPVALPKLSAQDQGSD